MGSIGKAARSKKAVDKFEKSERIQLEKKAREFKCNKIVEDKLCNEKATHKVLLELRHKMGTPLIPNNVVAFTCEEHKDITFDEAVPHARWKTLVQGFRQRGLRLNKTFCNIIVEKI